MAEAIKDLPYTKDDAKAAAKEGLSKDRFNKAKNND
jgi:hypothetical protein